MEIQRRMMLEDIVDFGANLFETCHIFYGDIEINKIEINDSGTYFVFPSNGSDDDYIIAGPYHYATVRKHLSPSVLYVRDMMYFWGEIEDAKDVDTVTSLYLSVMPNLRFKMQQEPDGKHYCKPILPHSAGWTFSAYKIQTAIARAIYYNIDWEEIENA